MLMPASRGGRIAAAVLVGTGLVAVMGLLFWPSSTPTPSSSEEFVVTRGPLPVRLVETGTLRPFDAVTYRSSLEGREAEVSFLAPEGLHVSAGDLIARLDSSAVQVDLERAKQALAQASLDMEIATAERADALLTLEGLSAGGETGDEEELSVALQLAERRRDRARREVADLEPLFKAGFVTAAELERATSQLEEMEAASRLAARRLDVLRRATQPREKQQAHVRAAQHESRVRHAEQRVSDARRQVELLEAAVESAAIYARKGGLVVHEEHASALPRRKVRVGDRVTPSQALVTIPELDRMVVVTSVREPDLHMVVPGLEATVAVEAVPNLVLTGRVRSVGTLARAASEGATDARRFDVIIDLDATAPSLRPEMTARLELKVADRADVVLVPVHVVGRDGGATFVQVVGRGRIERRAVEVGATNAVLAEIRQGLEPGERVRVFMPGRP